MPTKIGECGKREAQVNRSMMILEKATPVWNYLEDYWSCAGGLSAVNAVGTQLRDLIVDSGPINKWTPLLKSVGITSFNLSVAYDQANMRGTE